MSRRHTWGRALGNALLLPVALLIVLLEDVLWRGAKAIVRALAHLSAVEALRRFLARLPGWAALPVFLVPEAAGRLGELWAGWLLYRGHPGMAVAAYALVRAVETLVVVFIWQACEPALMRLPWFARAAGWVRGVRDWALARTAKLRAWARGLVRGSAGGLGWRVRGLRRRLRARLGGL